MKLPLILLSLTLAACVEEVKYDAGPSEAERREKGVELAMSMGYNRADAERIYNESRPTPEDRERYAAAAQRRQNEVTQVQESACTSDPSLSFC